MTRILVIDSDPESARFVELTLELEGFDIEVCPQGQRALDRLLDFRPDLVLLDVAVTGIDGLELTRQIRAHPRLCSVPLIMVTARSLSADRVLGLTAGADDYVIKPFETVELIARVRGVIDGRSGDEDISASGGAQLDGFGVDATVHLQPQLEPPPV